MSLIHDSSSSDRLPDKSLLSFANKNLPRNTNTHEKTIENLNLESFNFNNNEEIMPIPDSILTLDESEELKKIAREIVISTVDSSNVTFLLSLAGLLNYELGLPLYIMMISSIFITFLVFLRGLFRFYSLSASQKEFKLKYFSDLLDLGMIFLLIVHLLILFCILYF